MAKYRLIERNDGFFEYEVSDYLNNWHKVNYLKYNSEEAARNSFANMIIFQSKENIKRVIEEIEV